MSKLITFLPVLDSISKEPTEVAHFSVMLRNSRVCERYHLDAPVKDERSGAKGRNTITDNRYPIIKQTGGIVIDSKLLKWADNEVDMFRVKVNDKGNYMIDIILQPKEKTEDKSPVAYVSK